MYAGLEKAAASLRCSVKMLLLESVLIYSSGLKGAAGALTVWMACTDAVSTHTGVHVQARVTAEEYWC